MNIDELLAGIDFGGNDDSSALQYLKLDISGETTRHALGEMMTDTMGAENHARIEAGAGALRSFVYSMASVHLYSSDPASAYIIAASASEQGEAGALEVLKVHRGSAAELVRMAREVKTFLPDSSDDDEPVDSYPISDLADLRVSPYWELGFPFIVTVGSYIRNDTAEHVHTFIQSFDGHEFLVWVDHELSVLARMATACIQIIDEAIYRIREEGLTSEE